MTTYPRDKMAAIQARLTNRTEEIRNSRRYSDQGKRTELAKLVREARTQRDELKKTYIAERETRRETLQRILFGIPGEATAEQLMIMRDSRDRAMKLKGPDDAATHLSLALQAGDRYLAQAIAMVATDKGWHEVIDTYADRAPAGTRASLEELADIHTGPRTSSVDNIVFRLREPEELRSFKSDSDLERLANTNTEGPEPIGARVDHFAH